MVPANLLVIARTQSLARRLQEAVGADEVHAHWFPSTSRVLLFELDPAMIVVELPDSGGERAVSRLKRRFDVPLLALYRPGVSAPPGCDASLLRPFRMAQLARMVKEELHRSTPGILQSGDLSLDVQGRRLQVGSRFHQLQPIACQILALLMEAAGQVLAREELFRRVWNTEDGDSTRALDVHVSHLRRIIEANPRRPQLIVTERGIGYRLETRKTL